MRLIAKSYRFFALIPERITTSAGAWLETDSVALSSSSSCSAISTGEVTAEVPDGGVGRAGVGTGGGTNASSGAMGASGRKKGGGGAGSGRAPPLPHNPHRSCPQPRPGLTVAIHVPVPDEKLRVPSGACGNVCSYAQDSQPPTCTPRRHVAGWLPRALGRDQGADRGYLHTSDRCCS